MSAYQSGHFSFFGNLSLGDCIHACQIKVHDMHFYFARDDPLSIKFSISDDVSYLSLKSHSYR